MSRTAGTMSPGDKGVLLVSAGFARIPGRVRDEPHPGGLLDRENLAFAERARPDGRPRGGRRLYRPPGRVTTSGCPRQSR